MVARGANLNRLTADRSVKQILGRYPPDQHEKADDADDDVEQKPDGVSIHYGLGK
jgi:hypothetical protein